MNDIKFCLLFTVMLRFTFSADKTYSNNSTKKYSLESFLDKNFVVRVSSMFQVRKS